MSDVLWRTFVLLVLYSIGFSPFFIVSAVKSRRMAARLRAPMLNGIPLPMPDDPRWKIKRPGGAVLGPFHVERGVACIHFETTFLDCWPEYAERVFARFDAADHEAMARQALAAIIEENQ